MTGNIRINGDAPAIRVRHVGKTYRMWRSPSARLTVPLLYHGARLLRGVLPGQADRLLRLAGRYLHTHEALRDISFELMPGEALGIIGANGSGKSTLLQIIAGVLPPSTGQAEVHGRVAALLELGSGFNPELSGRENVRINAAILGLAPAQIDARMDEIVAFADIGDYVDQPVKTYSSGMALRLAFSVQVHIDPEVLIVDEALAVGDAAFQAKAMARIDHVLQRGTTLLFVGHDLNSVKAFCHRAMLLEGGSIVAQGFPDDVIGEYLRRTHQRVLATQAAFAASAPAVTLDDGFGLDDARVTAASINGARHVTVGYADRVDCALRVRLNPSLQHPVLILDILDIKGLQLSGRRIPLPRVESAREVEVRVGFAATMQRGVYRIRTRIAESQSPDDTTVLSRQEGTLSFDVAESSRHLFTGLFPLPMDIDVGP